MSFHSSNTFDFGMYQGNKNLQDKIHLVRKTCYYFFVHSEFLKKKTQTFGTFGLKCKAKRALKELTVNVETRLNGFDPVTPVGILTRNLTFKSCSI